MKFLHVLDLWEPPSRQWHAIPEPKETVVTANGQPLAILSAFSPEQMTDALAAFRRDQAMDAFVAIQYRSVQTGTNTMSEADIVAEIAAARNEPA